MRAFLAAGFCLAFAASNGAAQSVESQTRVTGPAGRTVERSTSKSRGQRSVTVERSGPAASRTIAVERSPGSVTRSSSATGPRGASVDREVTVQRNPYATQVNRQVRVAQAPGPQRTGGPRPVVVNRNTVVRNTYVGGGFGGWGPPVVGGFSSFNMFIGPPVPPAVIVPAPVVMAPPPVFVTPAPVVEVPPPNVVYEEPQRFRAEPETIVVDPVRDALQRLQSGHDNSRRDGALTLGRLGDARAVPALMERLHFDGDTDVRAAAAYALGEIGDPQARTALVRAAQTDRKSKVREEAALALGRLDEPRPIAVETLTTEESVPAPTTFKSANGMSKPPTEALLDVPPPPLPGISGPPDLFPPAIPPADGPVRRN